MTGRPSLGIRIVGLAVLLGLSQVPAAQAAVPHPHHWIAVRGCSASDPMAHPFGSAADLIVSVYLPEPTVQAQGQSGILVGSLGGRDATQESNPQDLKPVTARPMVSAIYADSPQPASTATWRHSQAPRTS